MTTRERILGGLWGSLVGDALGVPVEFQNRATVQANPVTDMRGYGTYQQPPGTWSDDSSLLLCSTDCLIRHEFDTDDMGRRFLAWSHAELWTPHGEVFDIGNTTADAISRIATGVRAELAGGNTDSSNGNGSLMRIIPVSIRFSAAPTGTFLDPTGCVAGGLAGVLYGVDAIPQRWRDALAKNEEIAQLFDQFADLLER